MLSVCTAVKNTEIRTDLLHWGTRFTITPLYRKQIADLHTLENGGSRTELLLNSMQYGAADFADLGCEASAASRTPDGIKADRRWKRGVIS